MISFISSLILEGTWFIGKKTIGTIWNYFRPAKDDKLDHLNTEIEKLEEQITELRKEREYELI